MGHGTGPHDRPGATGLRARVRPPGGKKFFREVRVQAYGDFRQVCLLWLVTNEIPASARRGARFHSGAAGETIAAEISKRLAALRDLHRGARSDGQEGRGPTGPPSAIPELDVPRHLVARTSRPFRSSDRLDQRLRTGRSRARSGSPACLPRLELEEMEFDLALPCGECQRALSEWRL